VNNVAINAMGFGRRLLVPETRRDESDTRRWRIRGSCVNNPLPKKAQVVNDEQSNYSERVILEVVNPDGSPNANMAHNLRLYVQTGGILTIPPSIAQWKFLEDLRRQRFGSPGGYPIL
jgi:hypothetical protein